MYKEFSFILSQPEIYRDIFIARLSELGFEGFVETEKGFLAYTDKNIDFEAILSDYQIDYQYDIKEIQEQNWNESWEKQIKPLVIDKQIYIKTSFHPDKNYPLVVTIDPKMSFGTGHHETTYLMIRQMLQLNWQDKTVLDMGAGTGVLAIIASKYGADTVYAVDNDKWAYENMIENFEKNAVSQIRSYYGDASSLANFPVFDVILANINRNILLNDMEKYINHIKKNGRLIISGFYRQDAKMLINTAENYGMIFEKELVKNNWMSLSFKKL
jgi:ribosomal protein L11 methyltransferase